MLGWYSSLEFARCRPHRLKEQDRGTENAAKRAQVKDQTQIEQNVCKSRTEVYMRRLVARIRYRRSKIHGEASSIVYN